MPLHRADRRHLVRCVDERGLRGRLREGRQLHPQRAGPPKRATSPAIDGRCLANQNALNTEGNPIGAARLHRRFRPAVVGLLRSNPAHRGRLPGRGRRRRRPAAPTSTGTPATAPPPRSGRATSDGELVNPRSGLCLTDPGGNTTARLDIATCADAAAQRWTSPTATTATTSTAPTTAPAATAANTASPSATGAPPASFWGNTSAIPKAKHVLEVKVINQTNGRYPNSEVYWSFDGAEKSIAQQPYIDMPANSSGRMYFYLGSPERASTSTSSSSPSVPTR